MSKARSVLDTMPDAQFGQLVTRLAYGMTYDQAVEWLKGEPFNMRTSVGALHEFYKRHCAAFLLRRRQDALAISRQVAADAKTNRGIIDAATLEAISNKAFDLAIAPGAETEDLAGLFQLLLKGRKQELQAETLEHAKERFRASLRTKMEAGLEALYQEIKENPKALKIFEQLKKQIGEKS